MALIADILLVGGALGAGLYCFVLSRRLARFNDLESGVGGAVAVLSAQVDDLSQTLTSAQDVASSSSNSLVELTARADTVARRLELLVASLHDIPEEQETQVQPETVSQMPIAEPVQAPPEEPTSKLPMFRRAGA